MNSFPYSAEAVGASVMPVRIDAARCTGCHRCVEACQTDILLPLDGALKPPTVLYPGECWYCGACVMECPVEGAITLRHPLMNRAAFVPAGQLRKEE